MLKIRAVEVEYCLDQVNDKHTKIAVSSTRQHFEKRYQKKCVAYSKMGKKTENISKIFRNQFSETFWSQYQIVPNKDSHL